MLTVGCMIKNVDFENFYYDDVSIINGTQENRYNSTSVKMNGIGFDYNTGLMLTQVTRIINKINFKLH